MSRRYDFFLRDILESIEKIKEYVSGMDFEDFKQSKITIDATLRNLEVIGEAVAQLPPDLKSRYRDIPWQEIKDFRNVVIHRYHQVDLEPIPVGCLASSGRNPFDCDIGSDRGIAPRGMSLPRSSQRGFRRC